MSDFTTTLSLFDSPPEAVASTEWDGLDEVLRQGKLMFAASHTRFATPKVVMPSAEQIRTALQADAVARRVLAKCAKPNQGDLVGVRLNLNVYRATGVCVHTIHRGGVKGGHRHGRGFWNGEVLHYAEHVVLRHAYFNVHQPGREAIACGEQAKHPMASIDGELLRMTPPHCFEGVEVAFNPKREHTFVDVDGNALWFAEEVTIVAHRAYARGRLVFHTKETQPARAGTQPSRAHLLA